MGLDTMETPKANGLKTALDTIIAPKEAFEALRVAPTWGWAFIITVVLFAAGAFIMTPALIHAMQAGWPAQVAADPRMAQMTPEQQQNALNIGVSVTRFAWIFALFEVPVIALITTVVLLIFKAIGRGDAGFGKLWALAVNVAVPTLGLGAIVLGVITIVRGADSFSSNLEVQTAMPSLAMLAPGAPLKLHAFLAMFTPFTIWQLWLLATGMTIVARVSRGVAWGAGIVNLLVAALVVSALAR